MRTNSTNHLVIACLAASILAGCDKPSITQQNNAAANPAAAAAVAPADSEPALEMEAFLASYAKELTSGDRKALLKRYKSDGAWIMLDGRNNYFSLAALEKAINRPTWAPPPAFTWGVFDYERIGPDAWLIYGSFVWDSDRTIPQPGDYSAVVVREKGQWVIHEEDVSFKPVPDGLTSQGWHAAAQR